MECTCVFALDHLDAVVLLEVDHVSRIHADEVAIRKEARIEVSRRVQFHLCITQC
jgi:hypothetical protein